MKPPELEDINRRFAEQVISFTQRRFRRIHDIPSATRGLCAALVEVWWKDICAGRESIIFRKCRCASLVEKVLSANVNNFYLDSLPPDSSVFEPGISALMLWKYGTARPEEIRALCRHHNVMNTLELDLVLRFGATIARRHTPPNNPTLIVHSILADGSTGLQLMLLRHAGKGRPPIGSGHRLAIVINSDRSIRFFDPDWGELLFRDPSKFRAWFCEFWRISDYGTKVSRPAEGAAPIRIFQFASPCSLDQS